MLRMTERVRGSELMKVAFFEELSLVDGGALKHSVVRHIQYIFTFLRSYTTI